MRGIADEHGVTPHIRFGCEMAREPLGRGRRAAGACAPSTRRADVRRPRRRRSARRPSPTSRTSRASTSFAGHRFHSARWDHDHDLAGERVAVIGTGPAAAQFVPRIQPRGRQPHRLPAHAAVGHPALRPAGPGRRAAALQACCRRPRTCSATALRALRGARRRLPRAHRADRADRGARPRAPAPPGPRPGAARQAHARATASAASARSCPTPTTRRWRPTTPRSSPTPIARSRAARSSRATATRHEVDTIITAIGYRYSRSLLVDRIVGRGRCDARRRRGTGRRARTSARPSRASRTSSSCSGPNSIGINSVIFSLEAQITLRDRLRCATMERDGVARIEVRPEALDGLRRGVRPPQRRAASGPTAAARPTTSTRPGATSRSTPASPASTGGARAASTRRPTSSPGPRDATRCPRTTGELDPLARLLYHGSVAFDYALRTGLASAIAGATVADGAARDRLAPEARRLEFYAELADARDATKVFAPPEAVQMRSTPGHGPGVDGGRVELLRFDSPYVALHPELRGALRAPREQRDGARPALAPRRRAAADARASSTASARRRRGSTPRSSRCASSSPTAGTSCSTRCRSTARGAGAGRPSTASRSSPTAWRTSARRSSTPSTTCAPSWTISRRRASPRIGLTGLSLGGYTTALAAPSSRAWTSRSPTPQ